ncbi:MAG: tyrosine-type recombinase/integrase [Pirellulales bacterium]|nr:tyrosine-type recombinase/integrase [Pirellulales bacterium]
MADARFVAAQVSYLEQATAAGVMPGKGVQEWLESLSNEFYDKLANTGLCEPRKAPTVTTLGYVIADYIKARPEAKRATVAIWELSGKLLTEYFGADCDVTSITKDQARAYRNWLITGKLVKSRQKNGKKPARKLSPSTAHKRLRLAKTIFGELVENGVLSVNPFKSITITPTVDSQRNVYVKAEQAQRLMEHCPDSEWRLLVALGRFGGFRNPCEGLTLKWQHIDWQREVIQIHSPKTGLREIPIFPELRQPLQECWEAAPEGAIFVITLHRSQFDVSIDSRSTNLTKPLMDIRAKSGLPAWPKPWHALRAAFVTDLVERGVPIPTAATWTGHSPAIMAKHYLRATADDNARAVRGEFSNPTIKESAPIKSANALQFSANCLGTERNGADLPSEFPVNIDNAHKNSTIQWAILGSNQ